MIIRIKFVYLQYNNQLKREAHVKLDLIMYFPLNETNVKNFIGKKIEFTANGYEANGDYRGVAIIKSVDLTKFNPIECECISGDDLHFAILDNHGLETTDNGNTYHIVDHDRCFSYSDLDREVFVTVCE